MSVIAFIPLRGGSKSIPLKNIQPFCGMPLAYWSIRALQDCTEVERIVVATDSEEIKRVVIGFGLNKVEVIGRLAENAEDDSSTESVMLEFISQGSCSPHDLLLLVQATNPFARADDFGGAIRQLREEQADSLLTCVRYKRFFWNDQGSPLNYDYTRRPRRQDFNGTWMENGAFYLSRVADIQRSGNRLSGKISIYEMPEYTAFELDEPDDRILMEHLFAKKRGDAALLPRTRIRLFLSDVDGVMTDAGMYYSEAGDELKKFNTHDGMAFRLLREAGIKTGIITTESTEIVSRRAAKLKADYLYQGRGFGSKLEAAREICEREQIGLHQVAYIGDDLNCIDLLAAVGLSACPSSATLPVKQIPGIRILQAAGGAGAVREFADWILGSR